MALEVATVVGTRPQLIKAAAVSRVLGDSTEIRETLIDTAQHYDQNMSKVFFDELDIPRPRYDLGIGSGTHGEQTGRMLEAIERVLVEVEPDRVLVYGDTNSTLAATLAAVKLHLPVTHVEAGLRSFNRRMPEEINRIVADQLADMLFAPTPAAVENLRREGIAEDRVHLVGDVMYDAALFYRDRARRRSTILERLSLEPRRYALATAHRAENVDVEALLRDLFAGLRGLAAIMPVVLPLHPRTRKNADRWGLLDDLPPGLLCIDPVAYLDMTTLEENARLIATDSGGVQKEAFFFRVPCLTLREETEWVELVELGWNRLVPPAAARDLPEIARAWIERGGGEEPPPDLFGGGRACERIREVLLAS